MNAVDNVALLLQALSLQILFRDYNNSDIMSELQSQDEKYLKTIIKQNNEILAFLRKEDSNAGEVKKEK